MYIPLPLSLSLPRLLCPRTERRPRIGTRTARSGRTTDAKGGSGEMTAPASPTANLRTKTLDFRGFDSSIVLNLRGRIPRPIGNFREVLSQAILSVGRILIGRLGVHEAQSAQSGSISEGRNPPTEGVR